MPISVADAIVSAMRLCDIEDCSDKHYARGMCLRHYHQQRRHGATGSVRRVVRGDFRARLLARIQFGTPDQCWPWAGYIFPNGYGGFARAGKTGYAHRFAYEELVGPIPDGLSIDHTCHNSTDCVAVYNCPHRRCCNPAHMEPVRQGENVRRGMRHR